MSRVWPWHALFALSLAISGCHEGQRENVPEQDGGPTDASVPAPAIDAAPEPDASPTADAGASQDAGPDPSDALFRPDHIVEVKITLAAADWTALRNQRPAFGEPALSCGNAAGTEAYTNFHADLSIDGVLVSDVAVRKKGNLGSVSSERPGLKLDVHEYVDDQRVFGLKHLTLNNNHQDPTLISQCLGYGLFHAAGLPASRCNFAHVVVNGEDLGIYSNVETIKKEFLAHTFADDSGELYESGGDFLPGRVAGFQPKSDTTPPDCSPLDAVTRALMASDAELEAQLGAVVDVAEFTRYWAMEVITDHWDGYANNQNNFYAYHDPSTGKLSFIPWGIDALFTERERSTRPESVFACGALAWRLYAAPATRTRYLATLRELMSSVWDVPAILREIDRMQALVTPLADPGHVATLADEIAKTRTFVSTRAANLLRELDAGTPVWPYPLDESCRIRVGSLSASFASTWGSLAQFDAGSGTITGTVAGVALNSSALHASAGLGDDGKPAIQLFDPLPDGRYAVVFVVVQDAANFTPGTHALDLSNVAAVMTFYDPATDTSSGGGLLFPGSLTLQSASSSPNGPVAGSLTGDILEI